VAFCFYFVEHANNLAVGADDERCALDAHYLLAIHVLFFDHPECIGDFLIHVGEQGIGQIVFILEFTLLVRRVGGDSQDHCAGFLQLAVCVAEPARFNGSARSVGLGIEEQHYRLPAQIFQFNRVAVLVR